MNKNVLVTGGAGYIGSHIVLALQAAGWMPVVIDDLSTGRKSLVPDNVTFIQGDCSDGALVAETLTRHKIDFVVHCAGKVRVEESVENPLLYYARNTEVSRALIETCVRQKISAFLSSSSAAVYDPPELKPITETNPVSQNNPYGRSKLMTEIMLKDAAAAHGLRYSILRYFNVAGADPDGRSGQVSPFVTHLIRRALHVAMGRIDRLQILGTDYATPDGTCLRDYIHVSDLAAAHVLCLDYLLQGGANQTINCGYGHGFSVREVVKAVENVTGKTLPVDTAPRRAGDPAYLITDPALLRKTLNWKPQYDDLPKIIADAYAWERRWFDAAKKG